MERIMDVEIVQTKKDRLIEVYHCTAFLTQPTQYCGHSSAAGAIRWHKFRESVEISAESCRDAAQKNTTTVSEVQLNVTMGVPASHIWKGIGSLDKDNNCKTTSFSLGGDTFDYQVGTKIIEFLVRKEYARMNEVSGFVTFESGIRVSRGDRSTKDTISGTYVWEVPSESCVDSLSQIYRGRVTVHTNNTRSMTGSLVILEDHTTNQFAGLEIQVGKTVCGHPSYQTHIQDIAVFFHPMPDMEVSKPRFDPSSANDFTRLETEISFLHVKTSMSMQEKLRQVKHEICANRREITSTRLEAIAGANNPYSLRKIFGSGHVAVKAGASVYVTRCSPVEVSPTTYPNCTEEIPVIYQNKTAFVDPISFVLKSAGSPLVCNDIAPPRWEIAGAWYCSYPEIRECHTPAVIPVEAVQIDTMMKSSLGLGKSIYSPEQLDSFRKFQDSVGTRSAYLAETSSQAYQTRGPNGEWGTGMGGFATGAVLGLVGLTFVPLYWIVGPLASWVILIMFIGGATKFILGKRLMQ